MRQSLAAAAIACLCLAFAAIAVTNALAGTKTTYAGTGTTDPKMSVELTRNGAKIPHFKVKALRYHCDNGQSYRSLFSVGGKARVLLGGGFNYPGSIAVQQGGDFAYHHTIVDRDQGQTVARLHVRVSGQFTGRSSVSGHVKEIRNIIPQHRKCTGKAHWSATKT